MIVFYGNHLFVYIIFQRFFHVIDDFEFLFSFKIIICNGLKWFDKLVDSPFFEKVKGSSDEEESDYENGNNEYNLDDYVDLVLAPPNRLHVDQNATEAVENEGYGRADLSQFAADGLVGVDVGDWENKVRGWVLDCCDAIYVIAGKYKSGGEKPIWLSNHI